tara:strand:+ start:347 stop:535 length:189 start_codon:yes stop_codon:yes gene_type:complete
MTQEYQNNARGQELFNEFMVTKQGTMSTLVYFHRLEAAAKQAKRFNKAINIDQIRLAFSNGC